MSIICSFLEAAKGKKLQYVVNCSNALSKIFIGGLFHGIVLAVANTLDM